MDGEKTATKETVRLAAVGDIHCSKKSKGTLRPLFTQMAESADIILLLGDLTDYGLPEEAHILSDELKTGRNVPIVSILGNHDYESGKEKEIAGILAESGIEVLDGDATEVQGIGFAGAKGFGGGFGERSLQPWGEPVIKHLVQEAINETLKLETALARLRTPQRIVLLHYSPVRDTVDGEPPEIFPFLGSSRLEEPINRYGATAVFHGHAHHGRFEGRTGSGIPVYNVAMALLRNLFPENPPFRLMELHRLAGVPHEE